MHLRKFSLYNELMNSRILQALWTWIAWRQLKPYIVGDSSYPLLQQLPKPYNARSNRGEWRWFWLAFVRWIGWNRKYNWILENKWTIVRALNYDVKYARTIIVACCVLHNFCKSHYDRKLVYPATDNTDNIPINVQPPIQTKMITKGGVTRCRHND